MSEQKPKYETSTSSMSYCEKCGKMKILPDLLPVGASANCTCPPEPAQFPPLPNYILPDDMPVTLRVNILDYLATIENLLREILDVLKPELIPYTGGYPKEAQDETQK
jgi:hypothetical protein